MSKPAHHWDERKKDFKSVQLRRETATLAFIVAKSEGKTSIAELIEEIAGDELRRRATLAMNNIRKVGAK